MNNKSKVSIIVAIYNIEKYITKCIESIINQDYTNLEILLVDDFSTDKSGFICEDYAKKDKRIKVIHHNKNIRAGGVRNSGLDNANGEYIVFVDGDDWLAPDFVSYMIHVITQTDSDMAINKVNYTTRDMVAYDGDMIEIWSAEKATAELLFPHLSIGCWNKIYKKSFIDDNKLRFRIDLFTAEGDRFINDAAQRANKVGVGCKKVYYYRLNNMTSATTKYDIRQSLGAIEVFKEIEQDLIIRTSCVLFALEQHKWLNHFWNLRQINALDLRNPYRKEYAESKKFVKDNFLSVAIHEPSFLKRVRYVLIGIFPTLSAKRMNTKFDKRLKRDIEYFRYLEKEGKDV